MSETLTPEAPTGLPPENNDTRHEKKSKYTPRQKLIAVLSGVAVALGVGVGIGTANSGERAPGATSSSAPANPTPEATSSSVPITGEYIVPLEQLASMTPEQLTAAATISVESVSVNGKIDWNKYSEKFYDILNLQVNAGATRAELKEVYDNSQLPGEVLGPKYDEPITAGLAAKNVYVEGSFVRKAHANLLTGAYSRYLLADKVDVSGKFTPVETTVLNEETTSGTLIHIKATFTDNLFSSGAVSPDDARSISALGRDTDAHNVLNEKYMVQTIDGNLVITSTSAD